MDKVYRCSQSLLYSQYLALASLLICPYWRVWVRKVGLFVENARGTFGGERKTPLTPSFYPLPILLHKTISTLLLSIILLYAHSSVFLSKVNKVCIIIATIPCKKILGTANSKGNVWFNIPYIYRKQAKTFIPTTI